MILVAHIWGAFDLVMFKVIWDDWVELSQSGMEHKYCWS